MILTDEEIKYVLKENGFYDIDFFSEDSLKAIKVCISEQLQLLANESTFILDDELQELAERYDV